MTKRRQALDLADDSIGRGILQEPLRPACAAISGSQAPTLDNGILENLRALQVDGEPDLLTQLVNLYLNDAPMHMAAISAAIAAADAPALRQAAHAFRGSSANLGAATLADMCGELEELGRNGMAAGAAGRFADVEREYGRVAQALQGLAG